MQDIILEIKCMNYEQIKNLKKIIDTEVKEQRHLIYNRNYSKKYYRNNYAKKDMEYFLKKDVKVI